MTFLHTYSFLRYDASAWNVLLFCRVIQTKRTTHSKWSCKTVKKKCPWQNRFHSLPPSLAREMTMANWCLLSSSLLIVLTSALSLFYVQTHYPFYINFPQNYTFCTLYELPFLHTPHTVPSALSAATALSTNTRWCQGQGLHFNDGELTRAYVEGISGVHKRGLYAVVNVLLVDMDNVLFWCSINKKLSLVFLQIFMKDVF